MQESQMAYDHPIETDDAAIPGTLRRFLRNRLYELVALVMFAAIVAVALSLATWSIADPSFNHAVDATPGNLLGYPGAVIADELMQLLGLGVLFAIAVPAAWAARLLGHQPVYRPIRSVFVFVVAVFLGAGFMSGLPAPANWALAAGLGGNAGDIVFGGLTTLLALGIDHGFAQLAASAILGMLTLVTGFLAAGIALRRIAWIGGLFRRLGQDAAATATGAVHHAWLSWRARSRARREERRLAHEAEIEPPEGPDMTGPPVELSTEGQLARLFGSLRKHAGRRESPLDSRIEPRLAGGASFGLRLPLADDDGEPDVEEAGSGEDEDEEEAPVRKRVARGAKEIKQGKRLRKDAQPAFGFAKGDEFTLPPLTLLAEPKKAAKGTELSEEALEQNARMLEGVLDDFGVKGQIIKVRPGPVVTLYELEPAPGIKSSRVISLADDIARSMSAVSARVAVVSGRNAIGIELPNSKRETVYLRELLASEAFEKTNQNLSLALGKNIGGEPIFADLARMPHLLIAGTTGSGKSVGINTMILSLVYRLTPDRCKLIMIDPKMLELSVYEGIPHLLSPVVTDPRKAVVALKWAVREMEDRYRKMSKVGVRNIDGFNQRLKQAQAKGETITRTVQTGFDPETGEPIFEREQMDLSPMPYIVVIIDEMADLMMVAGKDIEGAVQRLAQMARAAGIHVVMATQRPSVDVITGTIKANFPTRISFQVTSKIDSRTILGEQGAEQLLGQGDMLYMAGGGRISRLHGPFVSDDEVEKIVKHLKAQGAPEYVEAVTEEADEDGEGMPLEGGDMPGSSGDSLYDQAVAVVLRDKKVSTSYVQRRLQIGYNKAASLIERMEKEGLISAANATGKREILVPGDSARD
ncbi:MAG: DNA translocase FtsK 4TM domain-containing protein [Rhizobiales bacterium]|nr:DNA translocase FtsK 4TM domain-containing protein [Hyphomicrobiales bacterium]